MQRIPWFDALFSFGFGALSTWLTFRTGSWVFTVMAIFTLGAGVLFVNRSGWGHLLLAALFAFVVIVNSIPAILSGGLTFRGSLIMAACGWGAWSHWRSWWQLRHQPQYSSPPLSIVILLDQPSALDA